MGRDTWIALMVAMLGGWCVGCPGSGGGSDAGVDAGNPAPGDSGSGSRDAGVLSFDAGYAFVGADGGISSLGYNLVFLAQVVSSPIPATCADWTAVDAGNLVLSRLLQIDLYDRDGGQIPPGTYAACDFVGPCPALSARVQFTDFSVGGVVAESGNQGSVVLSSVGARYAGSYDVVAGVIAGTGTTVRLTGTFDVQACH